MARDTCRLPGCENRPGEQPDGDYRRSRFCSLKHDVKHEHLQADDRDARLEARDA